MASVRKEINVQQPAEIACDAIRETIVSVDNESMRHSSSARGEPFTHHNVQFMETVDIHKSASKLCKRFFGPNIGNMARYFISCVVLIVVLFPNTTYNLAQEFEHHGPQAVKEAVGNSNPIIVMPDYVSDRMPVVVIYHGLGTPASAKEMHEAWNDVRLPVILVFCDLPESPANLPEGGIDELINRQKEDYLGKLVGPILDNSVREFNQIIEDLKNQNGGVGPITVAGFSIGGLVAQCIALESDHPIDGIISIGAPLSVDEAISNLERIQKTAYRWTPAARAVEKRLSSFPSKWKNRPVAEPKLLVLRGELDEQFSIESGRQSVETWVATYDDLGLNCDIKPIPNTKHNEYFLLPKNDAGQKQSNTIREILNWLTSNDHKN